VKANTGFDFDVPAQVPATTAPTPSELKALRGPVKKVIAENYPEFARRVWDGDAARTAAE
jgi:glutaconate CoA-transferase subunit B